MKNKLFKKRLKEALDVVVNFILIVPKDWGVFVVLAVLLPVVFIPAALILFFSNLFPDNRILSYLCGLCVSAESKIRDILED